jgi:hypothetical protein
VSAVSQLSFQIYPVLLDVLLQLGVVPLVCDGLHVREGHAFLPPHLAPTSGEQARITFKRNGSHIKTHTRSCRTLSISMCMQGKSPRRQIPADDGISGRCGTPRNFSRLELLVESMLALHVQAVRGRYQKQPGEL